MRAVDCIEMCTYIELRIFISRATVFLLIPTSRGTPATVRSRTRLRFTCQGCHEPGRLLRVRCERGLYGFGRIEQGRGSIGSGRTFCFEYWIYLHGKNVYEDLLSEALGVCVSGSVHCDGKCHADIECCGHVECVTRSTILEIRCKSWLFLNEEHYKVRGFCDHNQFAVVGMGVPARIKLFRAQALRAVGGNGRRFSHNPPDPIMLDIYDNVGVVVMDENRLFDNNTKYVENMGALVKRDRNHPSITILSFCNEAGCEGNREAGGPSFREITYELDGSRPVLANMFTFNDLLSHTIM